MESEKQITPVFVISLPRSGSTLIQKMLAVLPEIATTAEPWICLPLAKMVEPSVIISKYWHRTCQSALTDLIQELPGGEKEYRRLAGDFARSIYTRTVRDNEAVLFLDKTPRYYWIVSFLADAFPDAKFIFLFRNPLEVLSSILSTWHNNRISPKLLANWLDIIEGPRAMSEGFRMMGDRAIAVNYSDLVRFPAETMVSVCEYLSVEYSDKIISDYRRVNLRGRMGDQLGVKNYSLISTNSMEKWKGNITNKLRKRLAIEYLEDLGSKILCDFDVDLDDLLKEIGSTKTGARYLVQDYYGMLSLRIALYKNRCCYKGCRGVRSENVLHSLPHG